MLPLRRTARVAALAIALCAGGGVLAAFWHWPDPLRLDTPAVRVAGNVVPWLAAREALAGADNEIIAGTDKRVRWQAGAHGRRTAISVVYLHGFSATRREIAPVPERLADCLGANLFETRLNGHGLSRDALAGVQAESWLADGAEALAVGRAIGDTVVLVGTSTGATLALAMADHPDFAAVGGLVLISPNFGLRDRSSEMLTGPGGPLLARLLAGETHSWTPANELQARFWTTRYPVAALVEMMRLVDAVRERLPLRLDVALLALLSRGDQVIDVAAAEGALGTIDARANETVFLAGGGPSQHVIAGDILAPGNTGPVSERACRFLRPYLDSSPAAAGL